MDTFENTEALLQEVENVLHTKQPQFDLTDEERDAAMEDIERARLILEGCDGDTIEMAACVHEMIDIIKGAINMIRVGIQLQAINPQLEEEENEWQQQEASLHFDSIAGQTQRRLEIRWAAYEVLSTLLNNKENT